MMIKPYLGIGLTHLITYFSLIVGLGGALRTLQTHNFHWLGLALAICFICDIFDGRFARWINKKLPKQTEFSFSLGPMIDTLTDFAVFGILPGLCVLQLHSTMDWANYFNRFACLTFILCSLTRLAVFQLYSAHSGSDFIGLPTTLSGFFLSLTLLVTSDTTVVGLVLIILSFLMILSKKIPRPRVQTLLVLALLAIVMIVGHLRELG